MKRPMTKVMLKEVYSAIAYMLEEENAVERIYEQILLYRAVNLEQDIDKGEKLAAQWMREITKRLKTAFK